MSKQTELTNRAKTRAFTAGLLTGLASPALLFAGEPAAPLGARRTSILQSLERTKQVFRRGVDTARDTSIKSG